MFRLAIPPSVWWYYCYLATGNIGRIQEQDALRLSWLLGRAAVGAAVTAAVASKEAAVAKELKHDVDDGNDLQRTARRS